MNSTVQRLRVVELLVLAITASTFTACDSDIEPALGEFGAVCRGGNNMDGRIPCDEGLVCYRRVGSAKCVEPTPVEGCPTTPDQFDCPAICDATQVQCECSGSSCGATDTCVSSCEEMKDYWMPQELAEYGCLEQSGGQCDAFDECMSAAICLRDD